MEESNTPPDDPATDTNGNDQADGPGESQSGVGATNAGAKAKAKRGAAKKCQRIKKQSKRRKCVRRLRARSK